jgi:hypothetical protein
MQKHYKCEAIRKAGAAGKAPPANETFPNQACSAASLTRCVWGLMRTAFVAPWAIARARICDAQARAALALTTWAALVSALPVDQAFC